jgi:hypothetical protein
VRQCCGSGSGMSKKSGSGSGMNNPDHISLSLVTFFGLKYLNSLMRIRDPGSGMEKSRIRDREKHHGYATLEGGHMYLIKSLFHLLKFEVSWALGDSILPSVPTQFPLGSFSVPHMLFLIRPFPLSNFCFILEKFLNCH